jgi:hypothetical protein
LRSKISHRSGLGFLVNPFETIGIACPGRLDLDDVSTEVRKDCGGGWAGDEAREIKHLQTGKDVVTVNHLIFSLRMPHLFAGHKSTLATPISCSSARLSSMCQLSVMRPFSILMRSVAMKGIG